MWLSSYYIALFSGLACGLVYGEVVAKGISWRWAFALEAIAMVPLALFPLLAPKRTQTPVESSEGGKAEEIVPFLQQVKLLFANKAFVLIALGADFFIFMAGASIFWGPTFQREMFGVTNLQAGLVLGAILIITGIIGTTTGSLIVDCMSQSALTEFQTGTQSSSWLLLARAERSTLFLSVTILCAGVVGMLGVVISNYRLFVLTLGTALMLTAM